jgi:hypothetical protein
MKTFARFAAVAALAASAAAFAGSAGAVTFVSIGTSGVPETHPQLTWTGVGVGFGTLASTPGAKATLYFSDPAFSAFSGLANTTFTLLGVANAGSGGALLNNGTTLTEKGIDGHFEFKNGSTVLLGGNFTGAWLQGAIGANSANFNNSNGIVTFYSSIPGLLTNLTNDSMGFSLTGVSPVMAVKSGHLKTFTAKSTSGSFDAVLAVPEPASWALMIMGFGGVGAMVRRRKTSAALA